MRFDHGSYWLFLLLLVLICRLLPNRPRKVLLLCASYYFYMSWNMTFAALILLSTAVDFSCGFALGRSQQPGRRKLLLALSCCTNLGLLACFKYANFFIDSFLHLTASLGLHFAPASVEILLPAGISFYTFQTLSYTIDVYRRELEPCEDAADFALFVAFFPQLVAGPIVRAAHFLPQLRSMPAFRWGDIAEGCWRIVTGLAKKIVLADTFGRLADPYFANPAAFDTPAAWLAVTGFALQIFFDFSAYSDIAIGSARLLGYHIPENFNLPYLARSIRAFWTRWHISLSSWLRDYLYIPLGGSRHGTAQTLRNLLITMFLGGLWHGASWRFVAWGLLHGLMLVLNHSIRLPATRLTAFSGWLLTLLGVLAGWVLFRAQSFGDALITWRALLGSGGDQALLIKPEIFWLYAFVVLRHLWALRPSLEAHLQRPALRCYIVGICLPLILAFAEKTQQTFIYFQF